MTKIFVEYVKNEMRYLKEKDGKIVDTCTDKIYTSKEQWLSDNFNITEADLVIA